MDKTKVRLSPSLLEYRQAMAQLVHEAREEKLRIAARAQCAIEPYPIRMDLSVPTKSGLIPSPRIELLWPELSLRDGQMHGLIQINTSDVFGILYISVTLTDGAGNLLEAGYALRNEVCDGHWAYFPSETLAIGTVVNVHAVAVDALGGMGTAHEKCTVCDFQARSS